MSFFYILAQAVNARFRFKVWARDNCRVFIRTGVEIFSPKAFPKWCVSVCFCNGLCHGNVSMVTWQRRSYSSMPLSGEYLGSLCLVGNDDNSAECWIKLNWGRLTPSYYRERRWCSSSFAGIFFKTSFLSYHFIVGFIFIIFVYHTLTDSHSNSSGMRSTQRHSGAGQTSDIFIFSDSLCFQIYE